MSILAMSIVACDSGGPTVGGALTITTDSSAYTAVPVGNDQVVVIVRTTFRNAGSAPVAIDRCFPTDHTPIYSVDLVSPSNSEGGGYSPGWACVGHDQPIVVAAGQARTDTLVLHGPSAYDNARQRYLGVLAGRFRIGYGGTQSNEFEIRLPEGGVVPNVARDLSAAIQTDSLLYHLRSSMIGTDVYYAAPSPIRASIFNPGTDTAFVINCNGITSTMLEKLQNGAWIPALGAIVPACLSMAIAIPPKGLGTNAVYVGGGAYKSLHVGPQFGVAYVPGVYRIVWNQIVNGFAMGPPINFGTPIPVEYRRSNAFAIVVEP